MSISKLPILKLVGLAMLSAVATFILLMFAASFVSNLPRPMQGESVSAPWPACVLGSVGVALFLPWLASLPLLRQPSIRIYFLICLAIAAAAWYFTGFDGLLSKAYRRGL